jgi:hypothetical protein
MKQKSALFLFLFVLLSSSIIIVVGAQVVPWIDWIQSYEGIDDERAYSVVATSDKEYFLVGDTFSFGFGDSIFCFVKIDNYGIIQEISTESTSLFEERSFQVHDTHDFYHITIVSNSTISDFYFLYDLMRISFFVNGTAGTTGLCNVTIPSKFMSTEFSIFNNQEPLVKNTDYSEAFNGTHYLFTITYEHSNHLIEIFANNNIPEFLSWTILPLFLLGTLSLVFFKKRMFSNRS